MDLFNQIEFSPREYQKEAYEASINAIENGKHPLIIMATGTGKTAVATMLIKEMIERGSKSLFLAHRDTLIEQAIQTIETFTPYACSKEKASDWADLKSKSVVGSVQTISGKRMKRWPTDHFSLITTDEAHHAVSDSYMEIYNYFTDFHHLGLTATPDRADEKELSQLWDEITYQYPLDRAIKDGHLSRIKGLKVADFSIDLKNLRIRYGDYSDKDLEEVIAKYMGPIAKSVIEITGGKKTLLFLPTVESSRIMAETLTASGVKADFVAGVRGDGNSEVLYKFMQKSITHLCSCSLLTEGFDEPSIEAIVMLRPTASRTLYAQMVGRGTRLAPGKEGLLLVEFTFNSDRLRLVSPYEMFANRKFSDKVVREAEKSSSSTDYADYLTLLEEADKRVHEIQYMLNDLVIKKFDFVEFDPFALGDILDTDLRGEFDYTYKGRTLSGPITPKQSELLGRYGITDTEHLDKAQASMLIDSLFQHKFLPLQGEASSKQIWFLKKNGVEAEGMTKAQASLLISTIKEKKKKDAEREYSRIEF